MSESILGKRTVSVDWYALVSTTFNLDLLLINNVYCLLTELGLTDVPYDCKLDLVTVDSMEFRKEFTVRLIQLTEDELLDKLGEDWDKLQEKINKLNEEAKAILPLVEDL